MCTKWVLKKEFKREDSSLFDVELKSNISATESIKTQVGEGMHKGTF